MKSTKICWRMIIFSPPEKILCQYAWAAKQIQFCLLVSLDIFVCAKVLWMKRKWTDLKQSIYIIFNNQQSLLDNIFFLPWPRSKGSAMTIRHPFLVLYFLDIKGWHKAKTSCHMHNTPRTRNIFYRFWPPYKMIIWGAD